MNPIFIAAGLSFLAVMFVITTVERERVRGPVTEITAPAPQQEISKPSDSGRIGMSYSGKIGVDLGGGLIVTSKGVELGFGF